MVRLVATLEPAQDADGVLDGRLADQHLLEAPLERRVLLDVLAVLVERGRADHAQLTAGEHRLEHVAGVHRAVARGARTDDGVQLVDERDDLAAGVLDLVEDGLEPLLELAAVLRAGDHRAEVEGDQPLAAQGLGHVTGDDALRQAFDDGGLADAGLADQHGVVLGAPREHLDDAADLGVAADHRVDLALARRGGQVDAVLLQRLERPLGIGRGDPRRAAHRLQRVGESGRRDAALLEQFGHVAALRASAISRCSVETYSSERSRASRSAALSTLSRPREVCGAATDAPLAEGSLSTSRCASARTSSGIDADGLQQRAGQPFGVVEQRDRQVGRFDRRVAALGGVPDGRGHRLLAAGGHIHASSSPLVDHVFSVTTTTKLSLFRSTTPSLHHSAAQPGRSACRDSRCAACRGCSTGGSCTEPGSPMIGNSRRRSGDDSCCQNQDSRLGNAAAQA